MKKLFTFGVLGLFMALNAVAADKPDNDAFYLVGTMTGWSYPETETDASGWEYKLTDEDGDGLYTGAFEIPKGALQFKLFATPGSWDTAEYYGAPYDSSDVFLLQEPYHLFLNPGYGSSNIDVQNWEGGTFSISARWNQNAEGKYMPVITMEGSNQPAEILKPDNDAFYIVGNMTEWNTPTEENAAEWPYRLTDEDGDGIFTGEFELPAGTPEFKVLSSPGNWDVNGNYGFNTSLYIFKEDTSLFLDENANPIRFNEWEGGKIRMSVEWAKRSEFEKAWTPRLVLAGADQPERPAFPDIYIIGDFNDWKLPTASDANGAMPFESKRVDYIANIEDLEKEFAASESLKFGICQLNPATGKYLFYVPDFKAPFTLYNYKVEEYNYQTEGIMFLNGGWSADAGKENYEVTVKDWKGGKLAVRCIFYYDGKVDTAVYGYDCPTVEGPVQPLYFLIETDGDRRLEPVTMAWNQSCSLYLNGKDVSLLLTSENSLTPAPENCWGIDTSLTDAGFNYKHTSGWVPMVKGGEPVSMKFPVGGNMSVSYMFSTTTVSVYLDYLGGPFEADKIYICGDVMTEPDGEYNGFTAPSVVNYDVYEKYWRLDEVEPGVFSKAYYVPEKVTEYEGADSLPQFRFFSDLLGWTREASLGSAEPDFYCLPVNLDEGRQDFAIIKGGLGNWGMNTLSDGYKWDSSWVRVVVDTNTGVVSFEKVTSGVDDAVSESEISESWYNLQGVKVEKPVKGFYIHVRNGKSAVEMVK